MFACSKVDNMQKPCLSLKPGFFRLVYCSVNLTLTDQQGTKNLWGLTPALTYPWLSDTFPDKFFSLVTMTDNTISV